MDELPRGLDNDYSDNTAILINGKLLQTVSEAVGIVQQWIRHV
jgi:hypothetical protein